MPTTTRSTTSADDHTDDLRLAHSMADSADALSTERFRALDLEVTAKPDRSQVTDADLAVEEALRAVLARARPRDTIQGEELGVTEGHPGERGRRRWVIDPIDATSNFIRGVPVWATLIALMIDDEVVVGVVSAPALGRRWWAAKGHGAFTGRSLAAARRLQVSKLARVSDASMSYSSLHGWVSAGLGQHFVDLMRAVWRTRAFGDFWSYMLLAEGAVDIACEPELALHDMAACDIVVTEAGGEFTSLEGRPGPHGPGAVAANAALHETVLRQLQYGDAVDPEAEHAHAEN